MKIENFDTGLKGQEDVENIIITPEENYRNKQKVKNYLTDIVHSGKSNLDDNLNKYFDTDVKVNCFHPINEFVGIDQFKNDYWLPLFESFPDLERRSQLIIGGAFIKAPPIISCCLLYTSPSPRDGLLSRMPSSA